VNDEEAIIARARHDPAAFAPIYRHYVRPIYAFCYQRLGDRELAEGATSQVFVNALAALPIGETYDGFSNPRFFNIVQSIPVHRAFEVCRPGLPLTEECRN
jgi:DNA-directed RNA polymerase specialized sigma24 family protein